jgi:hypothetical protein
VENAYYKKNCFAIPNFLQAMGQQNIAEIPNNWTLRNAIDNTNHIGKTVVSELFRIQKEQRDLHTMMSQTINYMHESMSEIYKRLDTLEDLVRKRNDKERTYESNTSMTMPLAQSNNEQTKLNTNEVST